MGNCFKFVGLALTLCVSTHSWGQWSAVERKAIHDTLSIANLNESDLNWDRQPFRDSTRMEWVSDALDAPLATSDHVLTVGQSLIPMSIGGCLRTLAAGFGPARSEISTAKLPPAGVWSGPSALKEPVTTLAGQIALASSEVRAATAGLTDEEKRQLIESLPKLNAEEFTPELDFVKNPPLAQGIAFDLLGRVDVQRIVRAAAVLNDAVEEATQKLRALDLRLTKPLSLRVYGRVVRIFGRGDDVHRDADASLEIDLGGNDTYLGRHGAGVGYASVLVDLNGNDRYEPKDLSIGAGVLGIGIARDELGDDVYRTKSLSLGCGLAGVGIMADAVGADLYAGNVLSQGFGSFGVGLLVDAKGDDIYDLSLYGQGAGRTRGFGVLIDRSGRDVYRAGGSALNSPLFEDVHYSFAQGMGMGYREDTGGTSGGIGMLLDGGGDDSYLAETYAQAASYWFGLGVLLDSSGNDTYSAYHYAQSSAMHCTAAFLFDLKGDDAYSLKFGAGHAIGHDYGVALLLDRAGNDVYSARDSNPAVGNANGLGIFVDAAGDDRYAGPPGRGNPARGSGSLGVFVDITGQDRYREGLADASATVSDSWGVAYDVENPRTAVATRPNESSSYPPGTLPVPSEAELSAIYQKASQWGVGTAQSEVDTNIARLVGIGLPAVQWMLDNRLSRADRLQARAFTAVIAAVGAEARNALARKVKSGNLDEQRNGLGIAVDGKFLEVGPMVPGLIENPSLRLQAVRAAGALASKESVDRLIPLTSEPTNLGLAAMVSLSQIGDERGYSSAEALITSPNLPVRRASLALIARFPLRASATAIRLLGEPDERSARIGIEVLAAVGTPETLGFIADRLLDPAPGIRIQCLIALNGRCPEDRRLTFMSLRNDPDPMVRAVALRGDPGR